MIRLITTLLTLSTSIALIGCAGKQQVEPEPALTYVGAGEHCSAPEVRCEEGLFCRQSVPQGEQLCYETFDAGVGEACGTIAGIPCQDGLVCVVTTVTDASKVRADEAGVCERAEPQQEEVEGGAEEVLDEG